MPIKSISSNPEELTVTVVGEYPVPVERLWKAYEDPRQLEKFWGPETWPARFSKHDMKPGGRSEYVMSGPDGETAGGWWHFLSVDQGRSFEVEDGFSDASGNPDESMPSMEMLFTFDETPTGSRMTCVTKFPNIEAMEKVLEMGMMEGMESALGQLDAVLQAA